MYPGFFWWWNPIIYFPLSGPVTQDISPAVVSRLSSMQRHMGMMTDALVRFAAEPRNPGEPGREREGLFASKPEINALDAAGRKARTEETRALLELLRDLDPVEFARLVRDATAEGGGDVTLTE